MLEFEATYSSEREYNCRHEFHQIDEISYREWEQNKEGGAVISEEAKADREELLDNI
jgi:hypothetical protein